MRRSLSSRKDNPGQHAVQDVVGQVSRIVCHSVADTGVQPRPVTSCCFWNVSDGRDKLSVDDMVRREIIQVDRNILRGL